MARRVGLGFISGLASRSALVYRKARSCIKGCMSADLSRMFKSTAMAASFTSLDGANAIGGKPNLRRGGGCTTSFPLFFAPVPRLLLSSSASALSIFVSVWERERVGSTNVWTLTGWVTRALVFMWVFWCFRDFCFCKTKKVGQSYTKMSNGFKKTLKIVFGWLIAL